MKLFFIHPFIRSLYLLHQQMSHSAYVVLKNCSLGLSLIQWRHHTLHVQELIGLDTYPHRELVLLIHSHTSITDLSLLICIALIQHTHRLEILLQAIQVLQHFLAVWHLLPSNDCLVSLEVLIQVIIAFLNA